MQFVYSLAALFISFSSVVFAMPVQHLTDKEIASLKRHIELSSCDELNNLNSYMHYVLQNKEPQNVLHLLMQLDSKLSDCPTIMNEKSSKLRLNSVITSSNVDVAPPELVHFNISKHELDISKGDNEVTITVRFYDVSGVAGGALTLIPSFLGSDSEFTKHINIKSWKSTDKINEYEAEATFIFDENDPSGVWLPYIGSIQDSFGNRVPENGIGPNTLRTAGFNPDFQLKSSTVIDTEPPELVYFDLSKQELDIERGENQVTMTVRMFDKTGIKRAYLALKAPDGVGSNFNKNIDVTDWNSTGNFNEFEAQATFTFSDNDPAGVWTGWVWYIEDSLGNGGLSYNVSTAKLKSAGFNPNLQIINSAVVDIDPPKFVSLTLNTNSVDVTNGGATVTMTARVYDESGVVRGYLSFMPPAGYSSSYNKHIDVRDWQETEIDNVFEAKRTFIFSEGTPSGLWTARVWWVTDPYNNGGVNFNQTAALIRSAGSNPDLFVNTDISNIPDVIVEAVDDNLFIAPGTRAPVTFRIIDNTANGIPTNFRINFDAAQLGVTVPELLGLGAFSRSCSIANSVGHCQLAIPEGVTSFNVRFDVGTSEALDYPLSLSFSSSAIELDYGNNQASMLVTGIRPRFEVTAQVIGNGTVLPSMQQILLGEQASFSFAPDTGYQFSRATGCGVNQVENSLKTLPISSACSIEVVFIPIVYKVELSDQFNNGEVNCNVREADFGSTIICVATAQPGYKFVGWQGQVCAGSARRCEFVLTDNTVLLPIFDVQQAKRKKLPLWLLLNEEG